MAKVGDKPASVLVDMGLATTAPDIKYTYLVITGPKAKKCNKHFLPVADEIPNLEEILDETSNFITGVTPKVLTGTYTHDCQRLNYYYVKDTIGIRNALLRMYGRLYPDYEYTIKMRKDHDWVIYRRFLFPDEKARNWMDNNKVITMMLGRGDSLTGKRTIIFDISFRADSMRSVFTDSVRAKGYKLEKLQPTLSLNVPFGLIISKVGPVKSDFLDPLTEELKATIKKYNGFFNGWDVKK